LGDRHPNNILFDKTNGDCVHVDLNMLFERSKTLIVLEVVPFRLTKKLIDAMGILGYRGLFTTTCEQTMDVLLRNKDALMSVFQTLGTCWSLEENVRLVTF
ncbi:kinase-like domain-containing protein, partial [Helicostylum pulchrum]